MPQYESKPPLESVVPIADLCGGDDLDTKLLRVMADEAARYVRSFKWCIDLHEQYFGDGYGGIVAVFLLRATIRKFENPKWIWVVVGDMPSAYMELELAPTPRAALLRYIEGVEEWLAASEDERASGDLIPIEVPLGAEFIEKLQVRMETIRSLVLPVMRES